MSIVVAHDGERGPAPSTGRRGSRGGSKINVVAGERRAAGVARRPAALIEGSRRPERRRTFQPPPGRARPPNPVDRLVAHQVRPRVGHDPIGDARTIDARPSNSQNVPVRGRRSDARGVRPQERPWSGRARGSRGPPGRRRDGPPQLQALLRVPEAAQGVEAIRVSPERQVMGRRLAPEQRRRRVGARERIVAARLDVDVRAGPVGRQRRAAPRRGAGPDWRGRRPSDNGARRRRSGRRARREEVPVIFRVVVADARRRRAVGATPHRSDHGTAEGRASRLPIDGASASMACFEAARWREPGAGAGSAQLGLKFGSAKPDTHQPACDGSGRTAVPLIIDRLPYVGYSLSSIVIAARAPMMSRAMRLP